LTARIGEVPGSQARIQPPGKPISSAGLYRSSILAVSA
jgi:hypothetical protein